MKPRQTHDEYQKTMKARGRADRTLAVLVFVSGALGIVSVLSSFLVFKKGELTGHPLTDLIVLIFIFLSSFYFVVKGHQLYTVFQCRFCLARIPEGSTYCPSCGADLLSNENPQKLKG